MFAAIDGAISANEIPMAAQMPSSLRRRKAPDDCSSRFICHAFFRFLPLVFGCDTTDQDITVVSIALRKDDRIVCVDGTPAKPIV
jgi:hypothetical protein